ncbi:MAG TPA: protein-L-isoaspartate(D-aspartate) O-methyltransferase [Bryobacteraceae bacterium]|nr:protein-L-isoaspartate(D-aspartate) O-methyltransferase [Bryobacteraceae bacterium]
MVEVQLRRRGIRERRVLDAMRQIPREEFVPPEARVSSYQDDPVYIGYGQTISQPFMTAFMAELLELEGSETVLDVGGGSGYHAAVLGMLAARVVSIEIIPALAAVASANLTRTGRAGNVTVVCGDGSRGWPEQAPYRCISVAAGAPEVPPALIEQLADPGRLVIPVGPMEDQELLVIDKRNGMLDRHVAGYCRFVPLRGGGGWR